MRLVDIKPKHIGLYLDGHLSRVSANHEIALLSRMYRYAKRGGWISGNPCVEVDKNKEKARDRYPEDWEYVAIREFCQTYKNENGEVPWKALAVA